MVPKARISSPDRQPVPRSGSRAARSGGTEFAIGTQSLGAWFRGGVVIHLWLVWLLAATQAQVPAITSFTASPATIDPGQSSTLAWEVAGATGLRLDPYIGPVTGSNRVVNPSVTTDRTSQTAPCDMRALGVG